MVDTRTIKNNLVVSSQQIDDLILLFDSLDDGIDRHKINAITFILFKLVDRIVNTEADIYNFLMGEQDGLYTDK